MENLFRITFSGQLSPGAHPDLVRTLIANRMKLTPSQVERMFCGKKVILKNNLPESEAVAFSARLSRLGMLVDILQMPPPEDGPETLVPPDTVPAPEAAPTATTEACAPATSSTAMDTTGPVAEISAQPESPASEAVSPSSEATAPASEASEAPPAATPTEPTTRLSELTARIDATIAAQASNPRFDESWLTQSSFANLARTHLNLDRAEALLNVASPVMPRGIDLDVSPQTLASSESGPVLRMFDPENLAEPITTPHQPIHISTEFSCTHCGTMHRIELNITQMEAPAQIRTRQDRASA